jgi:hypothetical protein
MEVRTEIASKTRAYEEAPTLANKRRKVAITPVLNSYGCLTAAVARHSPLELVTRPPFCLQRERKRSDLAIGAYPRVHGPRLSASGWHFPRSPVGRPNRPLRRCMRIQSNNREVCRHTAVL